MQFDNYLFWVYGGYFVGSVVFAVLVNFIFLKFAQNMGIRSEIENSERWNPIQKPSLGGISFYIIFLLSFTSYTVFFTSGDETPNSVMMGLLLATALSFLMGLADDAFNTRPMLKLGVQIASAFILIYTGTVVEIFESTTVNYLITVIWIVGMMNAINMLDNMDAITSVVSIIIIVSTLITMFLFGNYQNIYFFTLMGVLAALIGFLFFNWHPSSLFMGDTGSQFLGLFLGFIGIKFFWNAEGALFLNPVFDKFILIMAIFAIPLIDTSTVTINRILRKQSPMIGGKDHTTHTLVHFGLSERQVVVVLGLFSVLFSSIAIYFLGVEKAFLYAAEMSILTLFIVLFVIFIFLNRVLLKSNS